VSDMWMLKQAPVLSCEQPRCGQPTHTPDGLCR
jgi:hypothetical protein